MKARVILGVAVFALMLFGSTSALAHGTYPSEHYAAATCYRTHILGTWTVMSNVYMNRADGYPRSVVATGGGDVFYGGSYTTIDGHREQWLYYRVVVGTKTASGGFEWTYGNWIRRAEQLGDHTDGISTEFQMSDGTWRRTGYSATSSPWDVSLANGNIYGGIALDGGWKYVYGQMWWGPIYNNAGQQAFAPYTHWEPIGWRYCG